MYVKFEVVSTANLKNLQIILNPIKLTCQLRTLVWIALLSDQLRPVVALVTGIIWKALKTVAKIESDK
jgi:hypothetical protein